MMIPNIIKDSYLRVVLPVTFGLFGIVVIVVLAKFLPRGEAIVLHFDSYRGIDFVGSRIDLIGIILSGLVMLSLNFLLADFLYTRDRFFAYVLSFASLLLSILFTIMLAIVYSVN